MNTQKIKRKNRWIWLLIAVFFSKELLWSYLTPPTQAPDEIAHYGYIETLWYEHSLPVLGKTILSERTSEIPKNEKSDEYKPSLSLNWIAQHPPLYYLLLQPFYAILPGSDPVICIFWLRILSIFMGCITLWYAQKTLAILLPEKKLVQQAVIVGIAFLPMFSSISALLNNDNLVFTLASMLIWLSVKNFDHHDTKSSIKTGVLLGLLLLTKSTSIPLVFSILVLEIIKHLRWKTEKNNCYIKHQIAIFGVLCMVAGWWYVRNYLIYKTWLPNIGTYAANNPELVKNYPELLKAFPESSGIIALPQANWTDFFIKENFLWNYYKNIWGAFGQFFFQLFNWQYVFIGIVTVASILGYTKMGIQSIKNKMDLKKIFGWKGWTMLLPLLAVSAGIIVELFKIYKLRGFLGAMQGRYLFSAIIPAMYFFVRGIQHLSTKKYLDLTMKTLMAFFILNSFIAVVYRIIPEFY